MNNIPMRFKDFEFSVNPQKMQIKSSSKIEKVQTSLNEMSLENFIANPNVISGEGSFVGKDCQAEFQKLYEIFETGQAGELIFSGSQPLKALMTKLTKNLDSYEDVVFYEFEFVEVPKLKKMKNAWQSEYIIKDGETLWHVANYFNISIEFLMELNEHISNPFNVKKGDKVIIR